jgi:ribulose-bisphosphate carboxylase large chain
MAHPGGIAAGVQSIHQAWDAAVSGIGLAEYAKSHPELESALGKFATA